MKDAINRIAPKPLMTLYGKIVALYFHHITDCYILSFPKCGRTWLRVMLAKALSLHFLDKRDISVHLEPLKVMRVGAGKGPGIRFRHDGSSAVGTIIKERTKKYYQKYRRKKVIFLVRDPRDVMVSYYFHLTQRTKSAYQRSKSWFIRDPSIGVDFLIKFMNGWYEYRHVPSGFLLVRYEDLHQDPAGELRRVMVFLGLSDVSEEVIKRSVEYAEFDNMRRMSLNEFKNLDMIAPTDPDNPQSFKIREGKVGSYVKHLSAQDIAYIDDKMITELSSFFGYHDAIAESKGYADTEAHG
jgi:hypothetical protein